MPNVPIVGDLYVTWVDSFGTRIYGRALCYFTAAFGWQVETILPLQGGYSYPSDAWEDPWVAQPSFAGFVHVLRRPHAPCSPP